MKILPTIKRTSFLYASQLFNLILGWGIAKINTSYLSVSQYGEYSFFLTIANIIFVVFTFGLNESLSRLIAGADNRTEYRALLGSSFKLSLLVYGAMIISFWLSSPLVKTFAKIDVSDLMLVLAPVGGAYFYQNYYQLILRGSSEIKRLSVFSVTPKILNLLFISILAIAGLYSVKNTLIIHFLSILMIAGVFLFRDKPIFSGIGNQTKQLLQEVKKFGLNVYWGEIVKTALYHTDKLLISFYLSAEDLAYYALAYTLTFPISYFSNSLSTTLFKKFAQSDRIPSKVICWNFLWILLSIIFFLLFKDLIVLKLFSEKYSTSLIVFTPLVFAFGFSGMSKIYSFFLMARGEGGYIRNISVLVFIFQLVLNITMIPRFGILGAALTVLFAYIFDYILSLYYYQKVRAR